MKSSLQKNVYSTPGQMADASDLHMAHIFHIYNSERYALPLKYDGAYLLLVQHFNNHVVALMPTMML